MGGPMEDYFVRFLKRKMVRIFKLT